MERDEAEMGNKQRVTEGSWDADWCWKPTFTAHCTASRDNLSSYFLCSNDSNRTFTGRNFLKEMRMGKDFAREKIGLQRVASDVRPEYEQYDAVPATSSYRTLRLIKIVSYGKPGEGRCAHAFRVEFRRGSSATVQLAQWFCAGAVFGCDVWAERLCEYSRFDGAAAGECADNHLIWCKSEHDKFRNEHDAELGDERSDGNCDYAWDVYLDIDNRFDERQPYGDNDLHAYRDKLYRFFQIDCDGYCESGRQQADDYYVLRESDEH